MTSQDELVVFTDGSCTRNGFSDAKAASATIWPNGEFEGETFFLEPTSIRSNNRSEFFAIICAYNQADEIDPGRLKTLHVYTDCMLAINTITKWAQGWKRKGWKKASPGEIKNLDMVKDLHDFYNKRTTMFTHVKAHTGGKDYESVWNDKVDKLAYSAVSEDVVEHVVFPRRDPDVPNISTFFTSNKRTKLG